MNIIIKEINCQNACNPNCQCKLKKNNNEQHVTLNRNRVKAKLHKGQNSFYWQYMKEHKETYEKDHVKQSG